MAAFASFDPDHALAILLQARLNEESKKEADKSKNKKIPSISSTPETGKLKIQSSLTDPEWEVTDPCPDIHGLFLAFNDRFFGGRLQTVEVKWSPQMTSCAGICVYEGRNGLCSVRLSAPLLKLRPRSDLVETLLHEMIHAYLFVTHNNRDRDGHGPEFHKHMNRINNEAGTNISVYHSFNAEVRLYQKHWWRCQGPCQSRPPFFGMVKRAKDRAPGPNDLWWTDHQARCGGLFVKVREPEGFQKKKKKEKTLKPQDGGNIRDFFKKPSLTKKPVTATVDRNKVGSNIFGFNNLSNNITSNTRVKTPDGNLNNRITGFRDQFSTSKSSKGKPTTQVKESGQVSGQDNNKIPNTNGNPLKSGRGGMLLNRGGGTMVVTGSQDKQTEKVQGPNEKLRIDSFKVFSGAGFTLGGASSVNDRSRSRLLSLEEDKPVQKKQKVNGKSWKNEEGEVFKKDKVDLMCKCSVCGGSVLREEVDAHLESCVGLKNVFNNSSTEDNADEKEINDINEKYKEVLCPVCNQSVGEDINAHLDDCLNTSGFLNLLNENPVETSNRATTIPIINKNTIPISNINDSDIEIIEPEGRAVCPICRMRFGESKINEHVNLCLDSAI